MSYLVWRDTKAALLLFIRVGTPSDIITKALARIKAHPNHKRTINERDDGERCDFIFHANGDAAREIRLAFMPFVLPVEPA